MKFFSKFVNTSKHAFTLAEVLIAMTVIGIVAVMTIPALINSYQKDEYISTLHKFYNELDQAVQRQLTDTNAEDLIQSGLTTQAAIETWTTKYFKINKSCTGQSDNATTCLGDIAGYKKLHSNVNFVSERKSGNFYALANGAVIRPRYKTNNDPNCIMAILIDVNGGKKPNTLGRDVFFVYVYNNGGIDDSLDNTNITIDAPMSKADRTTAFADCTSSSADNTLVHGCFGQILQDNWEMKY